MTHIEITVPYAKRHLLVEIKTNGGKFNSEKKTWVLEDNPQNRAIKELIERHVTAPTQSDRIKNIASLSADLLNALKYRQYQVVEVGDRIIIESTAIVPAVTPPVVENTPLVAVRTPADVGSAMLIS